MNSRLLVCLWCVTLVACGTSIDSDSLSVGGDALTSKNETAKADTLPTTDPKLVDPAAKVLDPNTALALISIIGLPYVPVIDAGRTDAGGALDAGRADAGLDAGRADAGMVDAGPAAAFVCTLSDAGLPPLADASVNWVGTRFYDGGVDAGTLSITATNTAIVYNPSNTWALGVAQDLQRFLLHATNTTSGFTLVPQTSLVAADRTVVIAIGNTSFASVARQNALFRDGFYVQRSRGVVAASDGGVRPADLIVIAGGLLKASLNNTAGAAEYRQGTWAGVMGFLDRYAGVRAYLPSANQADMQWVSRRSNFTVVMNDVGFESEPWVESLKVSGMRVANGSSMPGEYTWQLRNSFGERRLGQEHQHNVQQIFPPGCRDKSSTDCPNFFTNAPDIFPVYSLPSTNIPDGSVILDGGFRYYPRFNPIPSDISNGWDQYWQPCFSAASAVPSAVQSLSVLNTAVPRDYVAISTNDFGAACPQDGDAGVPWPTRIGTSSTARRSNTPRSPARRR